MNQICRKCYLDKNEAPTFKNSSKRCFTCNKRMYKEISIYKPKSRKGKEYGNIYT